MGEGCRVGEAVGGRKRRAEWRTAGPNIAAYLRDSALAPDLGSAPAAGGARAPRLLPYPSLRPHKQSALRRRHLSRVGCRTWGGDAPPTRDHDPDPR